MLEMINKLLIAIFLYLCIVLLPTTVKANDAIITESGRSVYPINTDKVRMVSEHIKVFMKKAGPKDIWRYADIECNFVFENTSNQQITAKVGFPTSTFYDEEPPPFTDFQSNVDGLFQKVEAKKEILETRKTETPTWDGRFTYDVYRYWYVRETKFPPAKRLNVNISYTTDLSVYEYGAQYEFEYILKTGSLWKSNIEKATIEVIYTDEKQLKERFVSASPKVYKIKGNRIIWEFANFKPSENIIVIEKGE